MNALRSLRHHTTWMALLAAATALIGPVGSSRADTVIYDTITGGVEQALAPGLGGPLATRQDTGDEIQLTPGPLPVGFPSLIQEIDTVLRLTNGTFALPVAMTLTVHQVTTPGTLGAILGTLAAAHTFTTAGDEVVTFDAPVPFEIGTNNQLAVILRVLTQVGTPNLPQIRWRTYSTIDIGVSTPATWYLNSTYQTSDIGNFAMRIRATPEPSTYALLAMAGVIGLGFGWRRLPRRSSPTSASVDAAVA